MSSPDSRINLLPLSMDERNDTEKAKAKLRTLLAQREIITNDILQLKKMLAVHRILPREIISHIFSILSTEKISIPHYWDEIPLQITVSHVCSEWREIALSTPSLWNDVEITKPDCNEWVEVAIELLFSHAGMLTQGVNLALDMKVVSSDKMEKIVHEIVLLLHVKKLHLTLPLSALENLSQKSNLIINNIDEIALSFTAFHSKLVPFEFNSNQVSISPQFLSKIRSVTFLECGHRPTLDKYMDLRNLPWTQIRHLCCNIVLTLATIYDILRQSPLLDVCGINVEQVNEALPTTVLTLPQLRIFHLFIEPSGLQRDQDKVLRSFKCPNLIDFRFDIRHWTSETYKIIENHYNLHQLLRFEYSKFPYPVSKLLFDAPMLQELRLTEKVFVDEKASRGFASGELGRCLTSLVFSGDYNEKRVLEMVASRQRHVKQIVEASQRWQDQQISGIEWIALLDDDEEDKTPLPKEIKGKIDEVEKLGAVVYGSLSNSHPLSSLDSHQ